MESRKVVVIHEPGQPEGWQDFARYVSGLLVAETVFLQRPRSAGWDNAGRLRQPTAGSDLIIVQAPARSALQRLVGSWPVARFVAGAEAPVLFAHHPRWPFAHLLLVLRDTSADEPAIRWTLRLAAASGAAVTMLLVVPWQPALYATGSRVQAELEVLLAPNTPIGKKTRQVAEGLLAVGAPALAVRQQRGAPDRQMRQEMAVGDYDLVVIGAERGGRLYRWYVGELVPRLLGWCLCPVLVAERVERSVDMAMADG